MKNAIKGILTTVLSPLACCWPSEARGADPAPPRVTSPTKTTTPATTTTRPTSPTRASTPVVLGYYGGIYAAAPRRQPRRPGGAIAARRRSASPSTAAIISPSTPVVPSTAEAGSAVPPPFEKRSVKPSGKRRSGDVVCAGQVTVTPKTGTTICGVSASGVNIVFNGCQLSGGGTLDGTVDVQLTRAASDTTCGSATTITLGYTSTITNLTYTGTGGAKIVIPNEMSTSTLTYSFGQAPTTASIQTNGEIQRFRERRLDDLRPDATPGPTCSRRSRWRTSRTPSAEC